MVGRYWTKLYLQSKPWAEIQDESCLQKGCHDRRLLEGQVKFKTVVFDHKAHFADLKRGKQLRCTSCHSQIVQGEHITVTEASCFLCHFKKTENSPRVSACANCHKKETLTAPQSRYNHAVVFDRGFKCDKCHSQVVVGDGAVPRENCFKCHFEKDRLDKYGDTAFMHAMHITKNKIECTQCHLAIQHKISRDIEAIADCRTCHTGSHQAQKILFSGTGGRGVDLCFDHHCRAPYENLYVNIDAGTGSRLWASSGGGGLGKHCGARGTFWNVRSAVPQHYPPPDFGSISINVVAVQTDQPSEKNPAGRWFEAIPPGQILPQDIHAAQLVWRLKTQ